MLYRSNNVFVGSKCFSSVKIPIDLATLCSIDFIWNAKSRLELTNIPTYLQPLLMSILLSP